nr:hypothetical protein [Tanacetum cinerariifolium]
PSPTADEFSAEASDFLATHQASFRKFLESFLCLVGISRYYELDDNVYPQIEEGQVSLLESTRGRVVLLAGVNEQGNQNDDKRRRADGASGFDHPSKKLREDHVTSSDVGASTGGKSLAAIRELFERIVATTAIDGTTSALVHVSRTRPVHRRFFRDSVSPSVTEANIVGPSQPVGAVVSAVCQSMVDQLAPLGFFSQLRDMDYEQLFAEFNVGVGELNCFKERNAALEVSLLEATCFGLRDQVLVYELFKEQYEAVQDEQINILSDKVAGLDAELMEMALHLDGEFYPCFLTTIAGRRKGLVDVAAYNPSAKVNYVSAVNALRAVDFPLLAQL